MLNETINDSWVSMDKNKFKKEDFVSIGETHFNLDGKPFYPLAVNYMAATQTDGKDLWPRPAIDYTVDTSQESKTKEACLEELSADMNLIRQMGFNSVRIVGISEVAIVNDSDKYSGIAFRPYVGNNKFSYLPLTDSASYDHFFKALADGFDLIGIELTALQVLDDLLFRVVRLRSLRNQLHSPRSTLHTNDQ